MASVKVVAMAAVLLLVVLSSSPWEAEAQMRCSRCTQDCNSSCDGSSSNVRCSRTCITPTLECANCQRCMNSCLSYCQSTCVN
uniref:Uncharacterized protein n=1 Tax=Triticum urartu TaxID=4572 RepID=A0A8R7JV59_TRIUA